MISSRLIIAVLTLATGISAQCSGGTSEGAANCKTDPRLVSINCPSSGSPCTCSEGTGTCSDYAYDSDLSSLITFETASGEKCEELCQDIWDGEGLEEAKKCQYFKFEERPSLLPEGGRNCYFMSSQQCAEEADVPLVCEEPDCRSGQVNCGDPTSPPDPATTTCRVNMPELVPGNLHWTCFNGAQQIDPYGDKPSGLPVGTVCTSRHPCYLYPNTDSQDANATDYNLQFKCEESSSEPTTPTTPTTTTVARARPGFYPASRANNDGEWVSQTLPSYSSDPSIISEEGALTDPTCNARHLLLSKENYHQDGLLLQCTDSQVDTQDPENPAINAPNTCFLFCNFYSVMKIDTKWKDDYGPDEVFSGERQWRYVISGTTEEQIFPQDSTNAEFQSAAEQIKCWG